MLRRRHSGTGTRRFCSTCGKDFDVSPVHQQKGANVILSEMARSDNIKRKVRKCYGHYCGVKSGKPRYPCCSTKKIYVSPVHQQKGANVILSEMARSDNIKRNVRKCYGHYCGVKSGKPRYPCCSTKKIYVTPVHQQTTAIVSLNNMTQSDKIKRNVRTCFEDYCGATIKPLNHPCCSAKKRCKCIPFKGCRCSSQNMIHVANNVHDEAAAHIDLEPVDGLIKREAKGDDVKCAIYKWSCTVKTTTVDLTCCEVFVSHALEYSMALLLQRKWQP
ncbi:Hypothetical predicted protein [Octopus vulgaris]|uniref:Uncharacterized protein n=1 Tax=Octopus vulgaris TaxID=6645 RepID=A0AA36FIY2_OCTVU|nr:Hypothetical predicted protein [Octopus vulgaris]